MERRYRILLLLPLALLGSQPPVIAQTPAEYQLLHSTYTNLFPRRRPSARLLPNSFRIVQIMGEGYLTLSSGREVHAKAFKVSYDYTYEPPGAPVNRSNNIFDPTLGALPHRQFADIYIYWDSPGRVLCVHWTNRADDQACWDPITHRAISGDPNTING